MIICIHIHSVDYVVNSSDIIDKNLFDCVAVFTGKKFLVTSEVIRICLLRTRR